MTDAIGSSAFEHDTAMVLIKRQVHRIGVERLWYRPATAEWFVTLDNRTYRHTHRISDARLPAWLKAFRLDGIGRTLSRADADAVILLRTRVDYARDDGPSDGDCWLLNAALHLEGRPVTLRMSEQAWDLPQF